MPNQVEIVTFLQEIDIFSSLDLKEIEEIASKLLLEKIPAGYPVTEKALPAVCLYLVLDGVVEVVEKNEEGGEAILGEFRKGEYFGEISLLTGEACAEDTRTKCDTSVLVLYKRSFDEMLQRHPTLARHFLSVLSKRLQLAGGEIERARSKEALFNRFLRRELEFQYSEFVAGCQQMREVARKVESAAGNDKPVLITGQKGVGKELIARTIHHKSKRKTKPFIWVDCSLVEKQNWGVEIFGVEEAGTWRMGFLEIANGGTLLLTHIERLPSAIQCALAEFSRGGEFERAGSKMSVTADVKIIGASELTSEELETHHLHPELSAIFAGQSIFVPPLSARRRDLPLLIEHVLKKTSRRNDIQTAGVSSGAMEFLLNHDYPGNVDELENILERALILAGGGTILREHIIVGTPRGAYKHHINLLHLRRLLKFLRGNSYPYLFRAAMGILLTAIIVFSFWKSGSFASKMVTLGVWSIWWPALIIFTFVAARWWCGICPISLLPVAGSSLGKRQTQILDVIKRYDLQIMGAGMLLIFWFEEVFDMRHAAVGTGILISSIGGGALVSGLLFGRYAWCSHLCPLGGTLGIFSKASALELRSNANICTNQCKTHTCYKGNGYAGCPMLLHPLSLDTNQKCKMCFNCLKNCPHRSIRLDLRPVGEELWSVRQHEWGAGLFSLALLGALFPLIVNRRGAIERAIEAHAVSGSVGFGAIFALLLALGVGIAYGLFQVAERCSKRDEDKNTRRVRRAQYAQSLIPLALAGHVAYRMSQLPFGERFMIQLGLRMSGNNAPHSLLSVNLFEVVLFLLICAGFASTFYVFWRIYKGKKEEAAERSNFFTSVGSYVALAFVFGCTYFFLFFV
jgi:CRP-like cAMP-binding protein/polyferredoxin